MDYTEGSGCQACSCRGKAEKAHRAGKAADDVDLGVQDDGGAVGARGDERGCAAPAPGARVVDLQVVQVGLAVPATHHVQAVPQRRAHVAAALVRHIRHLHTRHPSECAVLTGVQGLTRLCNRQRPPPPPPTTSTPALQEDQNMGDLNALEHQDQGGQPSDTHRARRKAGRTGCQAPWRGSRRSAVRR